MNTTVRRTGLLLGSLALLAGHTHAAQAATLKKSDPAGDVTLRTCADPGDESTCTTTLVPTVADGDVVATTVTHGNGKVVVRTRYRGLTTKNVRYFGIRIVTNEGVVRDAFAYAPAGQAQPAAKIVLRKNGDIVRCGKFTARADMTAHAMTLSVPRSCLSYPRWVKVDQSTIEELADESMRGDQSFGTGPMPPTDSYRFSAQVRNN